MTSSHVVSYRVDNETVAQFEIEPADGFVPAATNDVIGRVWDAAGPAVEAAKTLLDRVKQLGPDGVEVKFGVKVTGTASWLVARVTTEGSFEVTLTWQPPRLVSPPSGAAQG